MKKNCNTNMPGRPRRPDSLSETAKRLTGDLGFPVSISKVRHWTAKGYALRDPEKLLSQIAGDQRPGPAEPKTIADAKLAKLLVDCEGARFRLDVAKGQYVPIETVRAHGFALGCEIQSQLMRLRSDAPTWAGQSPEEIERRVGKLISEIFASFRKQAGVLK